MSRLLDLFGSVKLTLAVLLGLAVVSVFGTVEPAAPGRFDLFYQSLWFRLLLGLLALNLAVCTWRTLQRTRTGRQRLTEALSRLQPANDPAALTADGADRAALTARLAALGYRTTPVGERLLASRGLAGRWSVPILHLAILAIMAGALAAELGFVGTINMYVGHQTDSYFDWQVEDEQPLGFSLQLDHFEPRYYPIDLRFATVDPVSREPLQFYTGREGETVDLGTGLQVELVRFFPEEEHLVLNVLRDGVSLGSYHALGGSRTYPNPLRLDVEIRPVAFRDPLLKQLHSRVTILEGGEPVRQGIIEVNQPLVHRGVAIYQTTYARDPSGFWTCGFQVSKDPGEPLVWFASILFSLALIAVFTVRPRVLGLIPSGNGWTLQPLTGFRGESGQQQLRELRASLAISRGSSDADG
ncbi:MAG: cytochrome c biogenesis protein ResB [Desulfuromonadales bacterium]|nr:cytochrome c biogenesis protein ResB [Desulfuromonadales bacterium]